MAGLPQPRRPARPHLPDLSMGNARWWLETMNVSGLSSGEVLVLPLLPLCHQGRLWGSVWGWWAFRSYGTCPNVFTFPRSPAELQADSFGRQTGQPGAKCSAGLDACMSQVPQL